MQGTEYVIEQLGQALQASHQALAQQRDRIAELEALLAEQQPPVTGDPR